MWFRFLLASATIILTGPLRLFAQYDKVAGLGSDTNITPIGGWAGAPPVQPLGVPYDLPDFRPVGKLNDQLPKWLQFGLDERLRWEDTINSGFKPGNSDGYLLERLRLGMILHPVSWFRIVSQLQEAVPYYQNPPLGPPNQNQWDLKLTYAEIGDPETQRFSLRVGRQLIDYNSTIIANSEWRNQGRAYDAAVANIHIDRFRLCIFGGSVVIPHSWGVSPHQAGNNIYGMYGGMDRVLPHSAIEPLVLWRVSPSSPVVTAVKSTNAHLNLWAYGVRVRGKDISNFDYRFEVIGESGTAGADSIRAWGTTFGGGYTAKSAPWTPRVFAGYDYASGYSPSQSNTQGTFNTIYPTAHDRFGITDQFGWQNIVAGRVGGTLQPHRRFSVTAQFLDFWLASSKDALYNISGGAIVRDPTGKAGTSVGQEFDFYTWYQLNRQVYLGGGIGHLLPGEFLAKTTQGAAYTYPYFAIQFFDGRQVR